MSDLLTLTRRAKMKTMLLGAVTLGLLLAAPCPSLAAPPRKATVKKSAKRVRPARKSRPVKATVAPIKKKKKQVFHFGVIGVTAAPEAPQAVYLIPKAKVKYTRPEHEQEILGWIMRSMRIR